MRRGLGILLAAFSAAAQAGGTVQLIGVGPGRAEIVVDGQNVRALRPGQVSPEGVELLELGRAGAVFAIDGKRVELALGQSTRPAVVLRADGRGQFVTPVAINGRQTQALVDTGATTIALSAGEAERLGLLYRQGRRVPIRTASGTTNGYLVNLAMVKLGSIVLTDVEAVVSEIAESPPVSLLGMSFLNRVDMLRSGDTLTLTQRR